MPSAPRPLGLLLVLLAGCGVSTAPNAPDVPSKPVAPGTPSASVAPDDSVIVKSGDRIAFLGDSITAGGASHGAFCRLVVHGLKTKGIRTSQVYAGVPGNKSSDMLLRLDGDVLSKKPDWVVLAVGVNDIWHGDPTVKIGVFQAKPGMGVGLEDYRRYVTRIVERTRAAGARVILTTITPIKEDPDFKLNVKSREYNAFLHDLAKRKGLPIAKLNEMMFGAIAEAKARGEEIRLAGDGVHPVKAGHYLMAKGILQAMGLTDEEVALAEDEWDEAPEMLFLGDRQVASGGRTGGWCHMVLDGMNDGREMVTPRTVRGDTVGALLKSLRFGKEEAKPKYALLVAPKGDAEAGTPLPEYSKTVAELIGLLGENGARPVVASIPVRNDSPASGPNRKIDAYNDALREVAEAKGCAWADINAAMVEWYGAHPGRKLTIFGERFNHEGSVLMARAVLSALSHEPETLDRLRETWDTRGSYTFRYTHRAKVSIKLSRQGRHILQEISDRFHKTGSAKLLKLGLDTLLAGDAQKNRMRVAEFDREWTTESLPDGEAPFELNARMSFSREEAEAIGAMAKEQGVGFAEILTQAFKIGVHAMWTEVVTGPGSR